MKTIFAIFLFSVSIYAQVTIKEFRIADNGHLKAIVIQVAGYEVILNALGIVKEIELVAKDSVYAGFKIEKGYIARNESKNNTLDFNDGKISAIGSVPFLYSLNQRDKIEEIGRMEFVYNTIEDKKDKIKKAGCVNIVYKLGTDMVQSIGNTKIEYSLASNRIIEVLPAKDKCSPTVRVICDIANFQEKGPVLGPSLFLTRPVPAIPYLFASRFANCLDYFFRFYTRRNTFNAKRRSRRLFGRSNRKKLLIFSSN